VIVLPAAPTAVAMATDKGGGDEQDWLFDYVMSVLKAPTWEVPIMTFIDDNCIVFDSEEENKFAYTELHEVLPSLAAHLAVQAHRVHASLTRLPSPLWGRYSPAAAILHAGGVSA